MLGMKYAIGSTNAARFPQGRGPTRPWAGRFATNFRRRPRGAPGSCSGRTVPLLRTSLQPAGGRIFPEWAGSDRRSRFGPDAGKCGAVRIILPRNGQHEGQVHHCNINPF